jgi:NDP-sugar pyrophosphorylase family protein
VHGLVLAGGEGSRLAAAGVAVPKPLVEVAGRPQIVRLLETLAALGCRTLTCAVRADFPAVARLLDGSRFGPPLTVVECRTPSSLHTLVEGLQAVPAGAVFCSMVDTVMRPEDWRAVYRATERHLEEGAVLVLAVTPYVDDESPVYVRRQEAGDVVAVGDAPLGPPPPCVTGGVYGLSAGARRAAADAVARGVVKMRGFLKALVADATGGRGGRGGRVAAVEVARIIDIDRPSDLQTANAWLAARGARTQTSGM